MSLLISERGKLFPYPCRDSTGSLIPCVSRERTFCIHCPFYENGQQGPGCLFRPSEDDVGVDKRERRWQEATLARRARLRREHKNSNGEPLQQNCWNCNAIRCVAPHRYVCSHDIDPISYSANQMQQRSRCELFDWRIELDILPFTTQVQEAA